MAHRNLEGREPEMLQSPQVELVSRARRLIMSHPYFQYRFETLEIESIDDRLVVHGQLPSFYLKQQIQEVLRCLGVQLVNRVEVVCSSGLSSVHDSEESTQPPDRKPR